MNKKFLLFTTVFFITAVLSTLSFAALEWTTTLLYFNIGAADDVTVTLLNDGATSTSPSGQATAQNIEFNITGQTGNWINATITGGGSQQDASNSILTIDNTGTTNVNITIRVNETLPVAGDCQLDLRFENDTNEDDILDNYPPSAANDLNTTNVTLVELFEPSENELDLWLFGNFSGTCEDNDDRVLMLYIQANFTG